MMAENKGKKKAEYWDVSLRENNGGAKKRGPARSRKKEELNVL